MAVPYTFPDVTDPHVKAEILREWLAQLEARLKLAEQRIVDLQGVNG